MGTENFWANPNLEPKRTYRFIMLIGGIPSWVIKQTEKPSFKVTKTTHKYLNHSFQYPGRIEWNPIKLTLVDPLTPDASRTIIDIVNASGYTFPTNSNVTSTISKARACTALGNVVIEQLDPDGNTADQWQFQNSWISDVNLGSMKYDGDDMVEISLEISFDWAEMTISGPPIPPANV